MKIAIEDTESEHTGSTVVGPVAGTIIVNSNNFVKIEGQNIMVEDGTMEIPLHQYQTLPPLFHSHSFSPDTLANNYFFIEANPIVLVVDSYSSDETTIKNAGSNTFVEVEI